MQLTIKYKDDPSKNNPTKIKLSYKEDSSMQFQPVKVTFKDPSSKKNPHSVIITYSEKIGCEEVRICLDQGAKKIRVRYIDSKEIEELIKNGAEVCYIDEVFHIYDPYDHDHYFRIIPSGENKHTHLWKYLKKLEKES